MIIKELPVTLKVKLTIFCFIDFEISSSFVGMLINGAGPGIQLVFLFKIFLYYIIKYYLIKFSLIFFKII